MMFYLSSLGCGAPSQLMFLQNSQIFLYIPPVSHERILCVFHVSLTKNAPGKHQLQMDHGFSPLFTSSEVNADDHGNWTQDLGGHTAMSEWNPRS